MISKSTLVLNYNFYTDQEVTFDNYDEDNLTNPHYLDIIITRRLWEDLGSPESITITIEPGDKLNV